VSQGSRKECHYFFNSLGWGETVSTWHVGHYFFLICIVESRSTRYCGHQCPIVPSPDDYDNGEIGGMIGSGNRSTRRKPVPVPLCPPQTSHAARTRTRAAAVGSQCLTSDTNWPIVVAPVDRGVWSVLCNEKPKYWEKTCPNATLSTINTT
jgi:hypothetical protein